MESESKTHPDDSDTSVDMSGPNKDSDHLASLIGSAEKALFEFQYDEALDYYKQALEIDPTNTDVLDAVGEVLIDLGDVENAQQISFFKLISSTIFP